MKSKDINQRIISKIEDTGAKKFERPDLKGLLKPETKNKDRDDNLLKKIPKVTVPKIQKANILQKDNGQIQINYKNVSAAADGKHIIVKFKSDRFVIFQSTIVASLPLQEGSEYLIHPVANRFVNDNGDCWDNETLLKTYKTFIGAPACLDHPDNPDQDNIGVILDAIPRRRLLDKHYGIYNYYIDILVAVDKEQYPEIADKILKRHIKYMSMGCLVNKGYCSRCGFEVDYTISQPEMCDHLKYQKGKTYLDNNGEKRVVGELLGKNGEGVKFIEASVLSEPPAFKGAFASRVFVINSTSQYIIKKLPVECLDSLAFKKYVFIS